MLDWRLASAHFILTVTLMLWSSGKVLSADVATEVFDLRVTDVQSPPTAREEKSATDLAAKLLLLDEFVSLENDVIETKKKRSFSGFGSPLDRLSAGSVEPKGKQRKFKVLRRAKEFAQKFTHDLEKLRMQLEYKDSIPFVLHGLTTKVTSSFLTYKTEVVEPPLTDFERIREKFQHTEGAVKWKVVDHPKRRFGIPVDRIGGNRLSNSRG